METFSQRHGLDLPDATEITVRHDAPDWLRDLVVQIADECGWNPGALRKILCAQLLVAPDLNNWSSPNVDREVKGLLRDAPWFVVYDLIERLCAEARNKPGAFGNTGSISDEFTGRINRAFRKKGVGWQLVDGQLQVRGPEAFEHALIAAAELAVKGDRELARSELHEARLDLSRRPEPDMTGAITHAVAALECVARDLTGQQNLTLGDLLKRNPDTLPAPLNVAAEKLWGYASENARHLREGRPPKYEDAELVVTIAASLTVYLLRKV
jgi:hypothetical protein